MTHDEMIAVIDAHKRGEKIEQFQAAYGVWVTTPIPNWNFAATKYRIARLVSASSQAFENVG